MRREKRRRGDLTMTANGVQLRDVPSVRDRVSPEAWTARIDLAACYRLAAHYAWADRTSHNVPVPVPGEPDLSQHKAHARLYDSAPASTLKNVVATKAHPTQTN